MLPEPGLLDVSDVGVVLGRHEQQVQPLIELNPIKRCDAHVQENSKEHGQGDLPEQVPDNNGEAYKQGHQQPRHPLLLDLLNLGLVPRRHSLAHDGERVGVSDRAHGGSGQPGQAKEGTDAPHSHDEQQVQVEAGALLQHALLLGDDQRGDLRLHEDEDED